MHAMRQLRHRVAGRLAVLILAAAPLFGFAKQAIAMTVQEDSIVIQGRYRPFLVYAPDASPQTGRLPILMVLHGGLGNGRSVARQTGFADYVDRIGLLAVFPNSVGEQWNDGRATTDHGLDDVAFLRGVIAKLVQTRGGDPSRVFAAGVSNGGMMAQRMACDAADAVTAVGSVIANMPQDLARHCHPSRPTPVMMISATEDPLMPWNGGEIASSHLFGGAGGLVVSALNTFKLWSTLDGCPKSRVTKLPGIQVKRHLATQCRSGTQVVLYEIDGGGHGWPGGRDPQGPIARRIIGKVSNDISASALLIRFFEEYGLSR
jgi:polyhydroxybutyrate depolymerase